MRLAIKCRYEFVKSLISNVHASINYIDMQRFAIRKARKCLSLYNHVDSRHDKFLHRRLICSCFHKQHILNCDAPICVFLEN